MRSPTEPVACPAAGAADVLRRSARPPARIAHPSNARGSTGSPVKGNACTAVDSAVRATTGSAVGVGVGGGVVPCVFFPETDWRRRTGGFGRGLDDGQVSPALVTAQFDAQVTGALVTTQVGLPAQTSPALVSMQPELPLCGVVVVVVGVVVVVVVVGAGARVVAVAGARVVGVVGGGAVVVVGGAALVVVAVTAAEGGGAVVEVGGAALVVGSGAVVVGGAALVVASGPVPVADGFASHASAVVEGVEPDARPSLCCNVEVPLATALALLSWCPSARG